MYISATNESTNTSRWTKLMEQMEQLDAQANTEELQDSQTVEQAAQAQQYQSSSESYSASQSASLIAEYSSAAADSSDSSDSTSSSDQTLINKANSGSTLTTSEMSRLKELDPVAYKSAVRAEQARAQVREQMKQNPSSATSIARAATSSASEEQTSVRMAIYDEYQTFVSKYDQMDFSSSRITL